VIHRLKTWPEFFQAILTGTKRFELRRDDRNVQIGDVLELEEFDARTQEYTQRFTAVMVTYVLRGEEAAQFGLQPGFAIYSLILPGQFYPGSMTKFEYKGSKS